MVQRRGTGAVLALLAALAWSLGFAIWAVAGTASTTCTGTIGGETCSSSPLVGGFDPLVLAVLAPAAVCLASWLLLRRYCTTGDPRARRAVTGLVALLSAFCVLAGFSVGIFVAPVALALWIALSQTEPPAHATP